VQKNRLIIALAVFAIAAIGAAGVSLKPKRTAINDSRTTPHLGLRQEEQAKEIWIGNVLSGDDRLSYNGYVVEKRHKKVRHDYPPKMRSRPSWIDISYAVIKRKDRVLAKFDDNIYFGLGNNIRFGLFSFLGGPTKELVISQDISRGGTQWVISLSPRPHIIFDGPKWAAGREGDDMRIIDLDNDGVYEIIVPLTVFYGFSEWVPTGRTPLPMAIFRYDKKAREYVPANLQFQDYLLKGVAGEKRNISPPEDRINHITDILPIVVDYIFAGKEKEAWTFFDESYKLSDKKEMKAKITAVVKGQPVYHFIYKKASAH